MQKGRCLNTIRLCRKKMLKIPLKYGYAKVKYTIKIYEFSMPILLRLSRLPASSINLMQAFQAVSMFSPLLRKTSKETSWTCCMQQGSSCFFPAFPFTLELLRSSMMNICRTKLAEKFGREQFLRFATIIASVDTSCKGSGAFVLGSRGKS